jgi:hypothetical protein
MNHAPKNKANDILTIWLIYNRPRDFPDKWVVRSHAIGTGLSSEARRLARFIVDSYQDARAVIPADCTMVRRHPADDGEMIAEVWL